MKKILTLTAIGTVLCASEALASGFNLREQSVSAMGNAFAGATAGAEDISYSYFNPAGLTRHKGTQINAGGTLIAPVSRGKNIQSGPTGGALTGDGNTGDIVKKAVTPNIYTSHQINDSVTAGVSFNIPDGMITKYDADWAGRYHGTYSKVQTFTLTPMLAYKADEKLSLGAGLQMQYIQAELRNSAGAYGVLDNPAKLKGDTFDVGYTVGALYEYSPQTRFGVAYRSAISHKLHGDIDFGMQYGPMVNQDISARLRVPANLGIGVYHDMNDKWSVMAEFGRTYWSRFKELRLVGEQGLNNVTEEKWKDTTFYAVGTSYQVNDKLKLRVGFAVDESAVGDHYRTPRIPDSDRRWYSAGMEYKIDGHWRLNAGYTFIQGEKSKIALDGSHAGDNVRGQLYGDYQNEVHLVGLGLNYEF